MTHDPSEYIRGLQKLLISDKKRIAFLFGAGTSLSKKSDDSTVIPAIDQLTQEIESKLNEKAEYKTAIAEVKQEITKSTGNTYNIETLLSNLEQKVQIIANGTLNGLEKREFESLIKTLKKHIKDAVSVHKEIIENGKLENSVHVDFAEWIGRANRKHPVEIFTINYDYLFELGLEEKNIPFYDGFTGSYTPFFYAESVENMGFVPDQTKLWKMHGSLGWYYDEKTEKVCRKDTDQEDILIYPSTLKYGESKKQPYVALIDRLTNFLKEQDTVLITCGYSFSDEHINERILTALNSKTSGHVFALFYDVRARDTGKEYLLSENSKLSNLAKANKKLSVYACRNAVIGGQFGEWQLKREPGKDDTLNVNLYFDEDAASDENIEIKKEEKSGENWTGKGELILPDFTKFVQFLQAMIYKDTQPGLTVDG